MTALANFKLVSAKRTNVINPIILRRNKLIGKLQEQMNIATAKMNGNDYSIKRHKIFTDAETGESKTVEVAKIMREWFWTAENGKIMLQVKYGAATLYLNAKNATAIELGSMEELVSAIKTLQTATAEGHFDKALDAASEVTRKGFGN
jgi:hypothetical protein